MFLRTFVNEARLFDSAVELDQAIIGLALACGVDLNPGEYSQ